MSADLDLTAAVEAAARVRYNHSTVSGYSWDDLSPLHRQGWMDSVRIEVTHAAPIIAAQVREQVAAEIAAHEQVLLNVVDYEKRKRDIHERINGLRIAARIARGE